MHAAALLARAMKRSLPDEHMNPRAGCVCMPQPIDNNSTPADCMLQRAMAQHSNMEQSYGDVSCQSTAQRTPSARLEGAAGGPGVLNCPFDLSNDVQSTASLPVPLAPPPLHVGLSSLFNFQQHHRFTAPSRAHPPVMPPRPRLTAPLQRGLEPASSQHDAARPDNRLSGPGLEEAYAAAPPTDTAPLLITMIRGRLYKPSSQLSKRRHVSCAKARGAHTHNALALARDPPIIPAGLGRSRSRAGITMPGDEPPVPVHSSAEARKRAELNEVERTLSIFTSEMAQSLLPFSDAERQQMRSESEEEMTERVRSFLISKSSHLASMSNARRALLSLYDYAASTGVTLTNFDASIGMISAFLSSQAAPTMAASRLQGLKWAKYNYSLQLPADASALKSYGDSRASGDNHATTMPIAIVCHLSVIAADKSYSAYLRAIAAGIHLMVAASLRWADAQRSTWKILSSCIEGSGHTKVGFQYWWGERKDLLDGDSWYKPLLLSYRGLSSTPDFIFRRADFARGHAGDPEHFQRWADGPAVKQHVIDAFIYLLTLPPISLTSEEARAYVRLHGARRVYATLARVS